MLKPRAYRGFTVVELLIALLLGTAAVTAGMTLLSTTLHLQNRAMRQLRMNQDLRQLLGWMHRDLARAGYWSAAGIVAERSQSHDLVLSYAGGVLSLRSVLPGGNTSDPAFSAPLTSAVLSGRRLSAWLRAADGSSIRRDWLIASVVDASTLTVQLSAAPAETRIAAGSWTIANPFGVLTASNSNCLVFSYDEDGDAQRGAQEGFGWRYSSSAAAVQMVNNTDTCGAGSWENVSDERSLRVTVLSLLPLTGSVGPSPMPLLRRQAGVTLAAQLRDEAAADRALRTTAMLRNDLLP